MRKKLAQQVHGKHNPSAGRMAPPCDKSYQSSAPSIISSNPPLTAQA
ncbi:MAG: hypothetical protein IKX63_00790 [Muribaculaceae bacterium]|nr:hypothetical protein [Muribaculaceae bacterium]